MKKPLLSVIIPVYNTANSVCRIIDRVLKQKMQDLELIIVDDGSTDNTPSVLKQISETDKRVILINQKNAGPSSARNAGIIQAKGEFILFLDSDDDIDPQMIEAMMNKQKSTNADVVTCAIKEIYPNSKTYVPDIEARVIDTSKQDVVLFALDSMGKESSVIYNPSNRIMRRSIIDKNNLKYRTDLRFGEDLAFNLEYLQYVKKIAVMNDPFYIYYRSSSTSVFSESALNYKYRQENTSFLWKFAKKSSSFSAHNQAVWVQTRWFLSFCKIICNSSLPFSEKVGRVIYACKNEKFKPLNKYKFLPFKNRLIIKITYTLVRLPRLFYFFVSLASRIKN